MSRAMRRRSSSCTNTSRPRSSVRARSRSRSRRAVRSKCVPTIRTTGPPARNAVAGFVRYLPVVGMNQPLPRADMGLDFIVFVTEHLLPPRRVDDGVALEVPVPHTLLRAGERELQPLLALPQCLFRPL